MKNFRDLVDSWRARGRVNVPPRTLASVATRFGVSRTTLHNLMTGRKGAATWTIRRISGVLGITYNAVNMALNESKRNYR